VETEGLLAGGVSAIGRRLTCRRVALGHYVVGSVGSRAFWRSRLRCQSVEIQCGSTLRVFVGDADVIYRCSGWGVGTAVGQTSKNQSEG